MATARSIGAFCVLLEGMGLYPRAFLGSLLICDSVKEAMPGDIGLAHVPPGEPVQALTLNGDDDLTALRSFVPFDGEWGYQIVAAVVKVVPPIK